MLRLGKSFFVVSGLLLLDAGIAAACVLKWEDTASLKHRSEAAIHARVVGTERSRRTFRSTIHTYKVIPIHRRHDPLTFPLTLSFEDLVVHKRGSLTVCPLKRGSGIEHSLSPGRIYKFYLVAGGEILLAEPSLVGDQ
jgi:hypothetical protein